MKKLVFSLLSVLLVLPMMISSFAACSDKNEEKEKHKDKEFLNEFL